MNGIQTSSTSNIVNKDMDLRAFLQVLTKRYRFIISFTLVCGLIAAIISQFVLKPVYEAKTLLMVTVASEKLPQATLNTQNKQNVDSGTTPMPVLTMNTYLEHLKSEDVMNRVLADTYYIPGLTLEKLKDMVNASIVKDSNLIEITAQSNDPQLAANVANSVGQEYVKLMDQLKFSSVMILSAATPPTDPIKPLKKLNVAMALLLGIVLSIIIAFLIEYLDNTIKTPQDVNRLLEQTVMGVIPINKDGNKNNKNKHLGLITFENPKSPISESFREFRTNLGFLGLDKPFQTILITSPLSGDGKSTIAANLAIVAAQAGHRVALVDCDLRKPEQHHNFKIPNTKGFTDCIFSDTDLDKNAHEMIMANLKVLTSGKLPPNPAEILSSERTYKLWLKLKTQYDYVFIDSPPLLAVTDANILAAQVDATILVVSAENTRVEMALQAIEKLIRAKSRLLGVVLNNMVIDKNDYYGNYH